MKPALLLTTVFLTACGLAPASVPIATETAPLTATLPPTQTLSPAPSPTPEPSATPTEVSSVVATEKDYFQSLTPEQQELWNLAIDLTAEGLARQVVLRDEYVVYVNPEGEIVKAFVEGWVVPAFMTGNNLLVNEASSSLIIINPEAKDGVDAARLKFNDYLTYTRARVCAAGKGIQLPKTLDGVLADQKAQDFLNKGCNINSLNLRNISKDTGYIIRFVKELSEVNDPSVVYGRDDNGKDIIDAFGFRQTEKGNVEFTYFHSGSENLANYAEYRNMILARRISTIFESFFARTVDNSAKGRGAFDPVTQMVIFNPETLNVIPPIIYSDSK